MRVVAVAAAAVAIIVASSAPSGCGGDDTTSTVDLSAASDLGVPAFDQGFARATEPDIASILLTLNDGEIMVAQAVKARLTSAAAADFAQKMIDMHGAAKARQTALFQQLALTPNDNNRFTMKLMMETSQVIATAGHLAGAQLDRFYVDTQVDMHKEALDLIDFVLLPNAATAALVSEIMATRATVMMHLDAATALQAALAVDAGI